MRIFKVFFIFAFSCGKVQDIDIRDYEKGVYFYNIKNYDSSIFYLKSFLRKVPRYKEFSEKIINAHILLAKSLEERREYQLAILVYNELLKYIKRTPNAEKFLDSVYYGMLVNYEKMRLKEQVEYYKKLLEKKSKNKK
ncbi:MAG: hypothetical protein RMJ38_06590 [candidate division WOR-3 bacterium]|nr:hypothetical protein [candidate division WOR-3 bacterium]MDW8151089.1 hypothetical protein [candidate division WOR-3 bacterium]